MRFTTLAAAAIIGPLSCASAHSARMLPEPPPVESKLVVVDWQPRDRGNAIDDLSVRSLQGLVNRKRARVWVGLEDRVGSAGWWLEQYRSEGRVLDTVVIDRSSFLHRYRFYARGVVVPPSNLGPGGYRVAVMRAAIDDLIVGSRELARELGLEVVDDYSARFSTYAESWQYALDNLWGKLCTRALFVDRDDLRASTAIVDYVVAHRLFVCAPHRDAPGEMELFRETLSRLPSNSPVIGSAGGGSMYNEGDIVRAVSKAGCVFAGCSNTANLTVHSAMKPARMLRQSRRQPPQFDPTRAYVAVEISDGDNANSYFTHFPRRGLWENRGRVPIGWTLGQAALELAPAAVARLYATNTPFDEFITGVSGYAYMFPGDFGNALAAQAKERAWDEFLRLTDEFLEEADIRTVTTLQYREEPGVIGDEVFSRYASGLTRAAGIINGYNAVYREYGGRTWQVVGGLPVFHTVTDRTWSAPGDTSLAREVVERTPAERPAFLALFMIPFPLTPDHFDQVVDSLKLLERQGYVLVLPSELADLARQANAQVVTVHVGRPLDGIGRQEHHGGAAYREGVRVANGFADGCGADIAGEWRN